jgi:hypothetical protein
MTQTTHMLMMMEPAWFHSNPQTKETNTYQDDDPSDVNKIHKKAVEEYRALRDLLVTKGVLIASTFGQKESPDDTFCNNWVSTQSGGKMTLYPMLAENRRIERRADLLEFLHHMYDDVLDLSAEEENGKFLESTGAHCLDRVNKVAYFSLSSRCNQELAQRWCDHYGYEPVFFNTKNHAGKPVYHTDVMLYIGETMAGICAECIVPEDRERVMAKMRKYHDVVEISMDQLMKFCGNALEVKGFGKSYLVMSEQAYNAYTDEQKSQILKHVDEILYSDIETIEQYGGGSARCMLLELF